MNVIRVKDLNRLVQPAVALTVDPGPGDAFGGLADLEVQFGLPRWPCCAIPGGGGRGAALRAGAPGPGLVAGVRSVPGPGWDEEELIARCRRLDVPTLIVAGAADVRSRWPVGSPAAALPDVARVVLPGAGHLPRVESPGSFGWAVLAHLDR